MKSWRNAGSAGAAILGIVLAAFAAQTNPPIKKAAAKPAHQSAADSKSEMPSPDTIVSFMRDRFGVPSTTKLTMGPLGPSADPAFYQVNVTSSSADGKQTKDMAVSISKDGRYLLMGPMVPLSGNVDAASVAQEVRQQFKVPANVNMTAENLGPSKYPGFLTTNVTASDGTHNQTLQFFVTEDKKFLGLGNNVFRLYGGRKEAMRAISLKDQPSQGSANAKVVIVEYADLECPSCARMHQYLEDQFLPKYGDKVRVIFKEFPLPMHPWGKSGAIADECAYQMDAAKFVPYRTLIFQHQSDVDAVQANSSQVRDLLLSYGEQAGLDRGKLGVCYDSQASKTRVEAGRQEGEELDVNQTPTLFVNGRALAGPDPATLTEAVDEALAEAKTSARASR